MFTHAKPKQKQTSKDTVQKEASEKSVTEPNQTGIPDPMKTRFENLSGFSFDDVRVHYNSDKPAQLQALAYTQGNEVHIAPGQEKHLGHELGHVVQQRLGRVRPTDEINGTKINDDAGLEREADALGQSAARYYPSAAGEYMKLAGVTRGADALQGRFGDVAQREKMYWAADSNWNVKNPKPSEADPKAQRWIREGGTNDRLYNTDGEAKSAAAVALGTSFAAMATDDQAKSMAGEDTMKDGFNAIRTSYGKAIVAAPEPAAAKKAAASAALATVTADGFGSVTTKLYDAYAAIANNAFQTAHGNLKKKKTAKTAADTAIAAAGEAIKAATGNAVNTADAMTTAATAAANATAAAKDEAAALRLATAAAITAGGNEVKSIAGHLAAKSTGIADRGIVAKLITDTMLAADGNNRSDYEQSKDYGVYSNPDYQKGVGSYLYFRPPIDTDGNNIKKGTPVLAKHTNDESAKFFRQSGTSDKSTPFPKVAHWHAGIVKEDKNISESGKQPEYVPASGISHFFIKPEGDPPAPAD